MQNVNIKTRRKVNKEEISGTLFASIPVLGFVIFGVIPMIFAVLMAFCEVQGLGLPDQWIWNNFGNFKYIFTDATFGKSILTTLFLAISMPISLVISLAVSVLLNSKIKGKKIFQTIYFIPHICSAVAVTYMWKWIYGYGITGGVLNNIIEHFGGDAIDWLGAGRLRPSLIVIGVWGGTAFNIILYSAALTKVNPSYYEAAQIDGANAWQRFWNVTIPAISPTTFYLLVMGLIGALQQFTTAQVMVGDEGGPNGEGLTIVFYLYRHLHRYNNGGYASAAAWILTIFILIITAINFKLGDKWVSYD